MTRQCASIGVDLGGSEIKALLLDDTGCIVARRQFETDGGRGRDGVLGTIVESIEWARGQAQDDTVQTVGVAVPAVLDIETGRIELMTNLTPDWNGFALRDELCRRTGMHVVVLNDVRAATYGEWRWGAGRPFTDFICIAVGTGIGGGLVLNGQLYLGSRGAAGEIGHMTVEPDGRWCNCGNRGCLEALSSGSAIAACGAEAIAGGDLELHRLTGSRQPTPRQLAEAAQAGNGTARAIFNRAGTTLGQALAGLVTTLNPQAVVVGGGIAGAGDLLLEPLRAELARRTVVFSSERGGVQVVASPLGGQAGAIGAAAWSAQDVRQREGDHL